MIHLILFMASLIFIAGFIGCEEEDDDENGNNTGDADDDDDDNDDDNDDNDDDTARQTLSLNGTWEVEQGEMGDVPPAQFSHTVPVPSLLTAATPSFDELGENSDLREAFWYRTTFEAPEKTDTVILNIHKAKYGIAVWLNNKYVGEHLGSFTLASFDVSTHLSPDKTNTLLIRVGDYLDSVPDYVPAGQDAEKSLWLPGIYDDVNLVFCGRPHIVRVKVEPDIDNDQVRIITTLQNTLNAATTVTVTNQLFEWEEKAAASEPESKEATLLPGEEKQVEQIVSMDNPHLWGLEDPFLYLARSTIKRENAATDNLDTRFGMRKVEWKAGDDKGFYLNNEKVILRGSNLTLHRFFEDELLGTLPWDRDWVRKLLTEYPRLLNWNTFRISIGRAPNFWYDIADEEGILLADEFMMWGFIDSSHETWSVEQMAIEFTEWIQENWNHPSIAWWDSSNETFSEKTTQVIDLVRGLDTTRQWENGGFKAPHGPADPIEDHPYIFFTLFKHNDPDDVDDNDGLPPQGGLPALLRFTWDAPDHAYINNEYGWLWISRTGKPTFVTLKVYYDILGSLAHSADVFREAYAYLVGGQTEFWRAKRGYAGIQHFSYLGYDKSMGATCDNFIDIENLILEPRWFEYAKNAFSPAMIYIDSWQDSYPADQSVQIPVQVINDYPVDFDATIQVLAVDAAGQILSQSTTAPISLEGYGAGNYQVALLTPTQSKYMIFARLEPDDQAQPVTWSRRKVGFGNVGEPGPDPPF